MKKPMLALFVCLWSASGQAPVTPIQRYISSSKAAFSFNDWNNAAPEARPDGPPTTGPSLQSLLPTGNPHAFVAYLMDTRFDQSAALASLATQVAAAQMNKMLGSSSGTSGTTSLVSGSTVADILSVATEFGAVKQTVSGSTTTVRADLAGVAGLLSGDPYLGCPSLAAGGCSLASRLARDFSASFSVDSSAAQGTQTVTGTNAATGTPASANIFANGNRMGAWGARYDFTRKSLYDTRKVKDFAAQWAAKMAAVSASPTEAELGASITAVLDDISAGPWRVSFVAALKNAPVGGMTGVLQQQLDAVIGVMAAADPQLMTKVQRAQNAIQQSFLQRDQVLRELQSNQFSVEFHGLHPLGQPNLSNIRAIYSYQPGPGPLLLTANFAAEWYDSIPSGVKVGRLRDLQAAVQADRRLGTVPNFGPAILTVAFYYQWMRDNALINIPAGNNAPGTGIVLPGAAGTLLATKGNIDIGQVKITIPMKNGAIKIPISLTWSNRTELINESEKRGQIGLTLDMDSFFSKQ